MSEKQPAKNQFQDLFKNKKKLSLLLLLLISFALVTTTILSLGSSSTSQSGNSQSSTPSSSVSIPSSSELFTGEEVPEWDLTKPQLSADSSSFNVGLDHTRRTRFQDTYYYATGGVINNQLPEAKRSYPSHMDVALRLMDTSTNSVVFAYDFNPGASYLQFLATTDSFTNSIDAIIAYGGGDHVYVRLAFSLHTLRNETNSALGGDFTPIIDMINETLLPDFGDYQDINEYHNFTFNALLLFTISNQETFTILGVSSQRIADILIDDNHFYLSVSELFVNSLTRRGIMPFLDIIEVTSTYFGTTVNYLYTLDIEANGSLTFKAGIFLSSGQLNSFTTIQFTGYREGFFTRYFNEAGMPYLSISVTNFPNNLNVIPTLYDNFNPTFVNASLMETLKPTITSNVQQRANRLTEMVQNLTLYGISVTFSGFLNLTTGLMDHPLLSYGVNSSSSRPFYVSTETNIRIFFNDGNIIMQSIRSIDPDTLYPYEAITHFFKEDRVTGEIDAEPVLSFEQNGFTPFGLYKKSGGYFLSATAYDYESFFPEVKKSAAVLQELDEDFQVIAEIVLDGSEEDFGSSIALNNQGQPVWFVSSRSIDGPFEQFASSNPNQALRTYTVTFNE